MGFIDENSRNSSENHEMISSPRTLDPQAPNPPTCYTRSLCSSVEGMEFPGMFQWRPGSRATTGTRRCNRGRSNPPRQRPQPPTSSLRRPPHPRCPWPRTRLPGRGSTPGTAPPEHTSHVSAVIMHIWIQPTLGQLVTVGVQVKCSAALGPRYQCYGPWHQW
jgi:hypothetical protein